MTDDVCPAFESFLSGGFEGADHINALGIALDMAAMTGHIAQVRNDYRRARSLGIRTVRESVGWRVATRDAAVDAFDFDRVHRMLDAAERTGLSIAWTLWHYGLPEGMDPFGPRSPIDSPPSPARLSIRSPAASGKTSGSIRSTRSRS